MKVTAISMKYPIPRLFANKIATPPTPWPIGVGDEISHGSDNALNPVEGSQSAATVPGNEITQ